MHLARWKCDACGYSSPRWFGVCPTCHNGTGIETAEEVIETARKSLMQVRRVNPDLPGMKVVKRSPWTGVDAVLSTEQGFVEQQVVLLGAEPGVGKSTLCAQLADERTLYISSEESYQQVNQRMLRVHPQSGAGIVCTTQQEEVLQAVKEWDGDFVVVDSLNSINFGVGYGTVARYASEITHALKDSGKCGIIISQVTKGGEIAGMQAIVHVVDTVLHMERSLTGGTVILTSSKNRFGSVGGVAWFEHDMHGLVEAEVMECVNEPQVGLTAVETRFGHKLINISVEALVAPASSQWGVRRPVGYSPNRLLQLVGAISYHGKLNLSDKDVYVSIGSGLWTDDVKVDLAVANSVISSLYGKAVITNASGEVRLNGRIIHGQADGRPVHTLKELLALYGDAPKRR